MAARRRRTGTRSADEVLFATAPKKKIPFEMVLTELEPLGPTTNPMFGCTAVYVDEKIVFILRERPKHPEDNGVWLATTREHHSSLRKDLPSLRSIGVLGGGRETGWQILPATEPSFEDEVLRACAMVLGGDPRIGKTPKPKKPTGPRPSHAKKKSSRTRGSRPDRSR